MSQMLKSSGAMAGATLASRVLGMVREMAYARFFGDSWVADAFMLAFTIPNLFRRFLGEGALTAAFVPIFKESEKQRGEAAMWRSGNVVLCGLLAVTVGLVSLAMGGITMALQFDIPSSRTRLMLELLRIHFPYLACVCLAAVFMGMLNARGHFFVPALGPVMLNVVMITTVLFIAPRLGVRLEQQVFALAFAVLVAGVLQAAIQYPALHREGFRWRWINPWQDETVRRVVQRMVPAVLGVAAYQINVLLVQTIAFAAETGVVASFNYAVRLMELPQGLFGISLATYLLPALSGLAAEKKYQEFRQTLQQGLGYLLFLNLICAVLLFTLAEPIVRLLFERGRFDAYSTHRASLALMCLAPGLLAFSGVNILARAFYALGDTRTPMVISVYCLAINLVLSAVLVWPFKQAGLGAANTLTSSLNAALLAYALRRKLGRLEWGALRRQLAAVLGAGVWAGLLAWFGAVWWESHLGHATLGLKTGAVFVPMLAAGAVYVAVCWWLRVPAVREVTAMISRALGR